MPMLFCDTISVWNSWNGQWVEFTPTNMKIDPTSYRSSAKGIIAELGGEFAPESGLAWEVAYTSGCSNDSLAFHAHSNHGEYYAVILVKLRAVDAGIARENLAHRAWKLMKSGDVSCYADLWEIIAGDVNELASVIERPASYVFACTIDDIECLHLNCDANETANMIRTHYCG